MKTNKDFMIRTIAGESVLIPVGQATQKFNGLITLNDVAAFIWEQIDCCSNREEIVDKVLEKFDVSEEEACQDVMGFTDELILRGMMEL